MFKNICLVAIVSALLSPTVNAKRDNYNIDSFIPSGPVYVQAKSEELLQCANQKVKAHARSHSEVEINIAEIANRTGITNIPSGLRDMLFTALYEITEGTNLYVAEHAATRLLGSQEGYVNRYLVAGAMVDFSDSARGGSIGGGLFTKYFGVGFGKGNYTSLLSVDLRLLGKNGRVYEVASLSKILQRLDRYAESDGAYRESGLHLNWGKDKSQSIAIAQRMLMNLAAVMFVEKVMGAKLTCKSNARRVSYSTQNIEEVVTYSSRATLEIQRKQFPRYAKRTFKCRGRHKTQCAFEFKGRITPELVEYIEESFRDAFRDERNLTVSCFANKRTAECRARGILGSFEPKQFKMNLYGE